MIDPTQSNATDDFVGGNDKTPKFERDDRFVSCLADAKPDGWDFGPGDNYFFVLPSSSDFARFFPGAKADYQIGKSYHHITVKKGGEKRPRNYRTPRDNPLSKDYWRLYESLSGNKPMWKEVTSGFQAGGDWRRCLNILVMKPGPRMSPVKMFRVPDERGGQKQPGQQDALYIQIRNALAKGYNRVKAQNPNAWPFFPQTAMLLKLSLSFRGTIPQYNGVDIFEQSGSPFVQDISALIGDLSVLDQAAQWCQEMDELPKITEIESVLRSPQACQILGLATAGVIQSAPVGAPAAPAHFQQQAASPFPAAAAPAFQPQVGAPTGFGAPAAPQAPVQAAGPFAAHATAPVPAAAPVNPAPNAAAASAMFAQQLQSEIAKNQNPASGSGGPF